MDALYWTVALPNVTVTVGEENVRLTPVEVGRPHLFRHSQDVETSWRLTYSKLQKEMGFGPVRFLGMGPRDQARMADELKCPYGKGVDLTWVCLGEHRIGVVARMEPLTSADHL